MVVELLKYFHEGVNHSLPGNGGVDCALYIPLGQKIVETLFVIGYCTWLIVKGYLTLHLPKSFVAVESSQVLRRLLLMMLSLVFGIEIGFKLAERTSIFLLNPCHLLTVLQIYLLQSDPNSRVVCSVFRIQLYCLTGATLALAFPVLNTRLADIEVIIYYLQHILLLIIPVYLMWIGGAYTPDAYTDYSWSCLGLAFLMLYHFVPLQMLGYVTLINLNGMLCPAISDPFRGRYYRCCAVVHQTLFVTLHTKVYTFLAKKLIVVIRFVLHTFFGIDYSIVTDPNSPQYTNGSVKDKLRTD